MSRKKNIIRNTVRLMQASSFVDALISILKLRGIAFESHRCGRWYTYDLTVIAHWWPITTEWVHDSYLTTHMPNARTLTSGP